MRSTRRYLSREEEEKLLFFPEAERLAIDRPKENYLKRHEKPGGQFEEMRQRWQRNVNNAAEPFGRRFHS